MIEEVAGQTLDSFLHERIFVPLGMTDTAYVVPDEDRGRVVTRHTRRGQVLVEQPNTDGRIEAAVRGDGNLFSTAADYALFVRMILNDGQAPDGGRLLQAATVELMSRNHIGDLRVELLPAPNATVTLRFPMGAGRDSFGLGFQIAGDHDDADMRSPGSLSWAGIYNTQFWIDPRNGIGAILLMQYWPFYDGAAMDTFVGFEDRVYRYLQ